MALMKVKFKNKVVKLGMQPMIREVYNFYQNILNVVVLNK